MARLMRVALTLALVVVGAVRCGAGEEGIELFGEEVDLLLRIREPDQTLERITSLINKVQPGVGEQLKSQQIHLLGQLISNPGLTGVDQSRDWYVGVYSQLDAPPQVVFAIPAIKPEEVVAAVGPEMTTQVHGRWVLYTDAETIPAATADASVSTHLGAERLKQFTTGDVTLYVNIEHLSHVYAEQIDLAQDKVLEALNQLRFLPQETGVNVQAMIEMYGTLAQSLFQGIEDGESSIIAMTITNEDVALTKHTTFAKDSAAAKFLAKNPTDEIALLTKLPAGAAVYYGFSGDIRDFTRFGLKMSLSMGDQKESQEKLTEQLSLLDDVNFGPCVAALDVTDSDQGMLRSSSIFSAEPVEKIRQFNREVAETVGSMKTPAFQQSTTLQRDAETFGPFKGDLATVKMEYSEDADPNGIQEKMQRAMFGDGGMEARTVYLDGKGLYATTVGGGQPAMQKLLDGLDSSKTNPLEKYRQAVAPKVNLLMFLDLAKLFGNVLRSGSKVEGFPIPVNGPMIDSLNLKPSYITMAAGSEETVLKSEFRLPIEQIIGLTKLGVLVGTSMQGAL